MKCDKNVSTRSLIAALLFLWAVQAAAISPDYLMRRLPLLPLPEESTGQYSSHSPHQQNGDVYNVLYHDENGDAVIFDAKGEGIVTSMWGTVLDPDATIKFYFGDETEPSYSLGWIDLFKGGSDLFPSAFNTYDRRGYYIQESMAANSFQPIPYSNGLKIAIHGRPAFFHVMYKTGSDPNLEQRTESLRSILSYEEVEAANKVVTHQDTLKAHGWLNILDVQSSGAVSYLQLTVPAEADFLSKVRIQMVWDDIQSSEGQQNGSLVYERSRQTIYAHVNAPTGHFFACPFKPATVEAYPVSAELRDNGLMVLTCRFVMPFWKNARIALRNDSDKDFNVDYAVSIDSRPFPEDRTAYFCTHYREGRTEYGNDWTFAGMNGSGAFVGVVQTCCHGHYCEGNEHFSFDGSRTPQINGTGTEDYYLGCFWPNTAYHTPLAGCVNDVRIEGGGDPEGWEKCFPSDYINPAAYYRFHLEMPLTFHSSMEALIQQGAENMVESDYSSLAFFYLKRSPRLSQTDYIDLGSQAARKNHEYRSDGKYYSVTSSYEGDDFRTLICDGGFRHSNGTKIKFTISIKPDNDGVTLRRRLDQGYESLSADTPMIQEASVYVDGKYAGQWYFPVSNRILRWADSDFFIPAAFSAEKRELSITLKVCSKEFNDFEYFSYVHTLEK